MDKMSRYDNILFSIIYSNLLFKLEQVSNEFSWSGVDSFSRVMQEEKFLEEHGLLGTNNKNHPIVRQQLLINMQYFKELDRLKLILIDNMIKDIFLIKGAYLLREVYVDMSERGMSDVDLYIPEFKTYKLLKKILIEQGYIELIEKKWQANSFKTSMIKKIGNFNCTLELHHKLLWSEGNIRWNKKSEDGPWSFLETNDHLVYLIAHLGKQHNFLKLFWLYDIKKYLEKFDSEINWHIVYEKLMQLNCSTCLLLSAQLMNNVFKVDFFSKIKKLKFSKIKFYLQKRFFNANYFIPNYRSSLSLILAKFLVKDNNWETIRYIFLYRRAK
jgi:hypothetical protein